jgi:hypothetical protein
MTEIKCPRCGHQDTFIKGFLPGTCRCRMCESQLSWREIPGMGPDCRPLPEPDTSSPNEAEDTGPAAGDPPSGSGEQEQA